MYFSLQEYETRLAKTRQAMDAQGVELLFITDPSNMSWLTGYDGWSFYVHQGVLVLPDEPPIWWGREMDVNGGKRTAYLDHARLIGYPDHYVMSTERHPMDHLSALIRERGWGSRRIGVEMDNYYFAAKCLESFRTNLPEAEFLDATGLANWQRAVKSAQELEYMRIAGRIVTRMHERIREFTEPGLPKNELVAEIYRTGIQGVDGFGGDYPAIVPMLPTGADASAPHLTWDEQPLKSGEGTFFEIAGCYRRYQCPLSRTLFLGTPNQAWRDAERALQESIEAGLAQARPGNKCEDIARAFNETLAKHGLKKDSRCGYPIGISYPPDWGERTMSLRSGDTTVLEPNMTFHFMPGLWFEDWGIEITESIAITEDEPECLASVPRELFVKG